jgi:hypothetical protein
MTGLTADQRRLVLMGSTLGGLTVKFRIAESWVGSWTPASGLLPSCCRQPRFVLDGLVSHRDWPRSCRVVWLP